MSMCSALSDSTAELNRESKVIHWFVAKLNVVVVCTLWAWRNSMEIKCKWMSEELRIIIESLMFHSCKSMCLCIWEWELRVQCRLNIGNHSMVTRSSHLSNLKGDRMKILKQIVWVLGTLIRESKMQKYGVQASNRSIVFNVQLV